MKLCKHGIPDCKHDCDYVDERDALIPEAEARANREAGPRPAGTRDENPECEVWAKRWNTLFHAHMDALWRGLKRGRAA